MSALITKSKYLVGLQCMKCLWAMINDKVRMPATDDAKQFIFDQGHLVGDYAKKLFPGGVEVDWDKGFKEGVESSKKLLEKRKPLFEAGFMFESTFGRADILDPVADDEWDLIEVKSSTSVKDVNIQDVAFQKYCYEGAGLKIRRCFLMHINNEYVKHGDIDPEKLFAKKDITEEVVEVKDVPENVQEMLRCVAGPEPDITIGPHCADPYDCPLFDDCWDFLPENSVFDLYRGGKKSYELFSQNILSIKDIPGRFKLSDKQQIQRTCEISGTPHVDTAAIASFLKTLHYPLYFLDFETFNPVIPLYDNTRPYQQIPFQFSLHVVAEGAEPVHHSFLAEGKDDQRPAFLAELKRLLGSDGSIVAYNQSFEIGRLKELADAYPENAEWVEGVISRFRDLLVPFRNFHYYSPLQRGSASVKKVLPAVTGRGYEDMEIGEGGQASREFLRITFGEADKEDIRKTRAALEKYCGLDTEGLIWILDELKKMVG